MSFARDLAYSVRSLSRSPGLTVALLATIAVGTGTHAAMSGFIHGLISRTAAIPQADRVVVIEGASEALVRGAAARFDAVGGFRASRGPVAVDGHTVWMDVGTATPGLWEVLRVPAALGEMNDIVISHRVWTIVFRGRQDVVGTGITVNGRPGRVGGVAPDWFEGLYFGRAVDVWVPDQPPPGGAGGSVLTVFGRLAEAASLDDVRAAVPGVRVVRYTGVEPDVAIKMASVERVLMWAAALVFLTAAANVSGFLLSRAARRSPETAARIALGASERDLVSLILADSLVISLCGGALGGLVAFWTARAFPALLFVEDAAALHFAPAVGPIARSAGGYAALMLICALAPLLHIRKDGPLTILRKSGGTQVTSVGAVRSGLVIAQMAVCSVLVIGSGFLVEGFRQSLRTARAERLGDPIVAIVEATSGFGPEEPGFEYFRAVDSEVRKVPGVTGAAWINTPPGGRAPEQATRFEPPPAALRDISIDTRPFPSGRDIDALELKAGRMFGGGDGRQTCPVAIVNPAAAERYFGGDAVGRSLQDAGGRRIDIVGVVAHKRGGEEEGEPLVYFYDRQSPVEMSPAVVHERFRVRAVAPIPPAAEVQANIASPDYFASVGASLAAGAMFPPRPAPGACDTVVVNREAARLYFQDNAIGGAVIDPEGRRAEIAGVVDDGVLRVTQRRPEPAVYYSFAAHYAPRMTLIAGAHTAAPELLGDIERRLRGVVGGAPVRPVITLEEYLSKTALGPERVATALVATSAAIALGLALLGVYGVMADSVTQKKREIALRLALGAQGWKIIAEVVRGGLRIAAIGAAAGFAGAWAGGQILVRTAPGFAVPAAWMWLLCPVVLTIVVAAASILPARYALAVDPLTLTREG
jgi:putative ABC transport system permease protein